MLHVGQVAVAEVLKVKPSHPGELTAVARMGSGSACRSLLGGLVQVRLRVGRAPLTELCACVSGIVASSRTAATASRSKSNVSE